MIKNILRKLKKQHDTVFSFFIYFIGLFSFLLSDLYIANNFSEESIAHWAYVKSLLLLVSTVTLLGYDQVFVRHPSLIKKYSRQFIVQCVIICLFVSFGNMIITNWSLVNSIALFITLVLLSILNYLSAANRANFNLWKAQFTTNLWKVCLLIFLMLFTFENEIFYFLYSVLLIVIIGFLIKGYIPKEKLETDVGEITLKEGNKIGMAFLMTNITLIIAVYGEQVMINLFEATETSSIIFTYTSIFTPIALSFNGFIGFYLGPKIRRQKKFNLVSYKKMFFYITIYSAIITLISMIFGIVYMNFYYTGSYQEINYLLVILISFVCLIRGMYISSSIGLGIFGKSNDLYRVSKLYWITTIVYLVGISITLYFFEKKAYYLIALLTIFNWFTRLLISNYYSTKSLKIYHYETK